MAEALGIVSSIISILQATQTVITYVREVDASSQERSDILSEANNLFRFFLVLKDKIPDRPQPRDPWYTTLKSFEAPDGPLEQLKVLLERLASKLKCAKVFKKFGNALFWPFRRQEVKEILDSIERQKNLISLALEKDHMYNPLPLNTDLNRDISLAIKTEVDGTYEKLTDIETSLKCTPMLPVWLTHVCRPGGSNSRSRVPSYSGLAITEPQVLDKAIRFLWPVSGRHMRLDS